MSEDLFKDLKRVLEPHGLMHQAVRILLAARTISDLERLMGLYGPNPALGKEDLQFMQEDRVLIRQIWQWLWLNERGLVQRRIDEAKYLLLASVAGKVGTSAQEYYWSKLYKGPEQMWSRTSSRKHHIYNCWETTHSVAQLRHRGDGHVALGPLATGVQYIIHALGVQFPVHDLFLYKTGAVVWVKAPEDLVLTEALTHRIRSHRLYDLVELVSDSKDFRLEIPVVGGKDVKSLVTKQRLRDGLDPCGSHEVLVDNGEVNRFLYHRLHALGFTEVESVGRIVPAQGFDYGPVSGKSFVLPEYYRIGGLVRSQKYAEVLYPPPTPT